MKSVHARRSNRARREQRMHQPLHYRLARTLRSSLKTADDVRKAKAAHGVSIFQIRIMGANGWEAVLDAPENRRITRRCADAADQAQPAATLSLVPKLTHQASNRLAPGTTVRARGAHLAGTYLACEENFNGYFSSSNPGLALPNRLQALRHWPRRAGAIIGR